MHLFQDFAALRDPRSLAGAAGLGLLMFVLAAAVALLIRRGARRIERHLSDATSLAFASKFAQFLAYVFAFVLYAHMIPQLRAIGTALLAGVSVVSVVLGIAAQNTLANLVAGISLVLSRTISQGDTIRINSGVGTITATVHLISLGFTVLVDDQNREVIVPNSVIMSSAITRIARVPAHTE